MRHDRGFADDARRVHAERFEHAVGEQVAVKRARRLADHDPKQQVSRIAVFELRTGLEVELPVERQCGELFLGVVLAQVERTVGVVRNAGRVCQQMPHGDVLPGGRRIGKELRDGIAERDLSVFDQQHDAGGREHLAERSGLKDRVRRHGHVVLDVRQAVAFGAEDVAPLHDRNGEAWNALPFHLGANHRI
jgi:hypothetical protein